jgi:hypothetical protein
MLLYCGLKLKRNIIPNPKYTVGVLEKANDNYYDNEIQRLPKELTKSLNTDTDTDPNASNSNTSNTSEHDMSTWEPSFEKRKRKRDQDQLDIISAAGDPGVPWIFSDIFRS